MSLFQQVRAKQMAEMKKKREEQQDNKLLQHVKEREQKRQKEKDIIKSIRNQKITPPPPPATAAESESEAEGDLEDADQLIDTVTKAGSSTSKRKRKVKPSKPEAKLKRNMKIPSLSSSWARIQECNRLGMGSKNFNTFFQNISKTNVMGYRDFMQALVSSPESYKKLLTPEEKSLLSRNSQDLKRILKSSDKKGVRENLGRNKKLGRAIVTLVNALERSNDVHGKSKGSKKRVLQYEDEHDSYGDDDDEYTQDEEGSYEDESMESDEGGYGDD